MVFVRIVVLLFWFAFSLGMGSQAGPLNGFGQLVAASFFVAAPALYFLPTYEAWARKHPNLTSIALINLLVGWSLVGWIIAIVWAHRKSEPISAPRALHSETDMTLADPSRKTKTCPYCAEQVLETAIKCKHCGSDLTQPPISPASLG